MASNNRNVPFLVCRPKLTQELSPKPEQYLSTVWCSSPLNLLDFYAQITTPNAVDLFQNMIKKFEYKRVDLLFYRFTSKSSSSLNIGFFGLRSRLTLRSRQKEKALILSQS
jgi:hypothetical protein